MTWCIAKRPPPPFTWLLPAVVRLRALLRSKGLWLPPSTEAYWASGSLLPPAAEWGSAEAASLMVPVPWDLHSDFLQLAFPFLSRVLSSLSFSFAQCTYPPVWTSMNSTSNVLFVFTEKSPLEIFTKQQQFHNHDMVAFINLLILGSLHYTHQGSRDHYSMLLQSPD